MQTMTHTATPQQYAPPPIPPHADEVDDEALAFEGRIIDWALGDPPRMVLACSESGNAVARNLAMLGLREFEFTALLLPEAEEVCTITAWLPQITTVITKFAKGTKVKVDVAQKHRFDLIRLLAFEERTFKFIFTAVGVRQSKKEQREARARQRAEEKAAEKLAKQTSKEVARAAEDQQTPEQKANGKLWSVLIYSRTFGNFPGVRERIEKFRRPEENKGTREEQHEILKRVLGVENLSDVPAGEAIRFFKDSPAAASLIDKVRNELAVKKSTDGSTVRAAPFQLEEQQPEPMESMEQSEPEVPVYAGPDYKGEFHRDHTN